MNARERSFWRKVVYLVAIMALLLCIAWLGAPATTGSKGSGGKLSQLRADYRLNQTHLGEIDATSETIKLVTLGLRGVAANILWGKAHEYKKKKDWTNLEATVEQITKLEPNFVSVWIFQGWNLSYNVSAEFDDFRERFRYVLKGINFLKDGVQYNEREPRLPWEIGWVISQKIGRADERRQFRRLFKQADRFHRLPGGTYRPLRRRDNWLVGKQWFRRAERLVDTLQLAIRGDLLRDRPETALDTKNLKLGRSPLIFRSSAPMCQMNYADNLEKDGHFGERSQYAWQRAARDWHQYGRRDIPTAYDVVIHLNDLDRGKNYEAQIEQITEELDGLEPGLRQRIRQERKAKLTDEQRQALDTPPAERTGKQHALAAEAERKIKVTHEDVAKRITDPKKRTQAIQLYRDLCDAEDMAKIIRRYRDIVNFSYWRLRANVEQTDEALAARELVYEGERVLTGQTPDLAAAKRQYEEGLGMWRRLLDRFPEVATDKTFGADLMEVIQRYREVLDLCDAREEREITFGTDLFLFSVGSESQGALDRGVIPADLRHQFEQHDLPLSDDASVTIDEKGSRWSITDRGAMYQVEKEADTLHILKHFILSDIVELHEEGQ